MVNKSYKTVQIPAEEYELLREYCDLHGLKMGRLLGMLIKANCPTSNRPAKGNILRVENKSENQ